MECGAYSVIRALRAVDRSDVALAVLDVDGVTEQDKKIVAMPMNKAKPWSWSNK